ncbi:hypothetical protein [Microbispora hainanensis]|uniref:hypothetical protein n=1 Tax=Microbispora hainanensis TaxID=568844 RepID=UPI003AF3CCE4
MRRDEHDLPGSLVHIDVKKLGNTPDGGGHRVVGRAQGKKTSRPLPPRRRNSRPLIGFSYLHTALDDHSCLAYTEILADERKDTAPASSCAPRHGSPPVG